LSLLSFRSVREEYAGIRRKRGAAAGRFPVFAAGRLRDPPEFCALWQEYQGFRLLPVAGLAVAAPFPAPRRALRPRLRKDEEIIDIRPRGCQRDGIPVSDQIRNVTWQVSPGVPATYSRKTPYGG
jgi:hypothetical protein